MSSKKCSSFILQQLHWMIPQVLSAQMDPQPFRKPWLFYSSVRIICVIVSYIEVLFLALPLPSLHLPVEGLLLCTTSPDLFHSLNHNNNQAPIYIFLQPQTCSHLSSRCYFFTPSSQPSQTFVAHCILAIFLFNQGEKILFPPFSSHFFCSLLVAHVSFPPLVCNATTLQQLSASTPIITPNSTEAWIFFRNYWAVQGYSHPSS